MAKMIRNAKGRFAGSELDPEIRKMIDEERDFIENLLETSLLLNVSPETVGLRMGPSGEYHVSYLAVMMFMLERRTANV